MHDWLATHLSLTWLQLLTAGGVAAALALLMGAAIGYGVGRRAAADAIETLVDEVERQRQR